MHIPLTKFKIKMQVATPSIMSAFGEKLKIKKTLFMYTFPLTFKNWEES